MCLDRDTVRTAELRAASCSASFTPPPPHKQSCQLNWNSEGIFAARTCHAVSFPCFWAQHHKQGTGAPSKQQRAGTAWAELQLCLTRASSSSSPSHFHCTTDHTTLCSLSALWQINSGVLQHTSTISSWRGRQRPAEGRDSLPWQNSTLQG